MRYLLISLLLITAGCTNNNTYVMGPGPDFNDINVQGTATIDENIILKSPNNTVFTCDVTDSGAFQCS